MKPPLLRGCALFLCLFVSLWAQSLKLPGIFSDHLVLQAGEGTPVFGWATPGAQVQVVFALTQGADGSVQASALADKDGKWLARLPKLSVGQRGILSVLSNGEKISFNDALVGEVWLCSGQSNMQWSIGGNTMTADSKKLAAQEAAQADGNIRMFRVKLIGTDAPQDNLVSQAAPGGWEIVTPQNVNNCTAIGWNFGFDIFKAKGFPVGIISSNWGGTPVEAWMPKASIDSTSVAASVWQRHQDSLKGWEARLAKYKEKLAAFLEKYKTSAEQLAHKPERPREPYHPEHSNVPTRLYNAMIHPLEPYGLRGVLWYQGETNGDFPRSQEYGELIQTMVKSWRERFQNPNLAFYYVELANYKPAQETPVQPGSWAYVREQQGKALLLPHTGVATAIDLGVANNIHPGRKKEVADRLAGLALNDLYGQPSLCRSPEYVSSKIEGGKVFLQLANADGLRSRTEKIGGFAIAGADNQWVWAESVKILPNGVVEVASAQVAAPVAVRYAWANNPVISLENSAGLPLRPFRTDPQSKE